MQKEILFLVYKEKELHPNDYANVLYWNIIQKLLECNEKETIELMVDIDDEDAILSLASHFASLSGKFQSDSFIGAINSLIPKFCNSKNIQFLQSNIQQARDVLDKDI